MKEQIKKFLNEEQDPKAIEKVTSKLQDILMRNEEVGYIAVQKMPALTVFPESIVMTNKRIIICQPKNFGLSMEFTDFTWDVVEATFIKENILGSEFSFSTKTQLQVSIDYIPKIQARKIFTYAKEQLDILKNGIPPVTFIPEDNFPIFMKEPFMSEPFMEEPLMNEPFIQEPFIEESTLIEDTQLIEEMETDEVMNYAEIMPVISDFAEPIQDKSLDKRENELTQDELFAKLQNYKKLLDNGLIMQGEYDAFKKIILSHM